MFATLSKDSRTEMPIDRWRKDRLVMCMLRREIPVSDPYITQEDVNAVTEAIKNKRLSQGKYVDKFEQEFANYLGCKYAIAVMNGTAALHLAVLAIDIKPGDEIIVPSFTFAATVNCVLYANAKPVFVDIDPNTYNIDPERVEEAISVKTKAIIPMHYAGQTANMDAIQEIAEKYDLYVIEDAAEAHGATYKNQMAGTMGDIGCFSFYPNKSMTTGEGGMIVTDNEQKAERAHLLRNHGQSSRYHHVTIGYNYRMTDLQAALGISQLKKLDWILQKKQEAADYYRELLSEANCVKTPYVMPHAVHTYMFYTIKLVGKQERDRVMQHLNRNRIETRIAFPPIHLQPPYKALYGDEEASLSITEECANKVLSLPIFPHILRVDQEFIVKTMLEEIKK